MKGEQMKLREIFEEKRTSGYIQGSPTSLALKIKKLNPDSVFLDTNSSAAVDGLVEDLQDALRTMGYKMTYDGYDDDMSAVKGKKGKVFDVIVDGFWELWAKKRQINTLDKALNSNYVYAYIIY